MPPAYVEVREQWIAPGRGIRVYALQLTEPLNPREGDKHASIALYFLRNEFKAQGIYGVWLDAHNHPNRVLVWLTGMPNDQAERVILEHVAIYFRGMKKISHAPVRFVHLPD